MVEYMRLEIMTSLFASAATFFDATLERIFEESGKGMLASL